MNMLPTQSNALRILADKLRSVRFDDRDRYVDNVETLYLSMQAMHAAADTIENLLAGQGGPTMSDKSPTERLRKKLEEDALELYDNILSYGGKSTFTAQDLIALLDRQAAITERECLERTAKSDWLGQHLNAVMAENHELHAKLDELGDDIPAPGTWYSFDERTPEDHGWILIADDRFATPTKALFKNDCGVDILRNIGHTNNTDADYGSGFDHAYAWTPLPPMPTMPTKSEMRPHKKGEA